MTSKVSTVETNTPNINEIAMPWKIGSVRMTLAPPIRANAVIMIGRVRAFEAPHTGENYLTHEMVFQVGRKHAAVLKVIALVLAFILPVAFLMLPFHHVLAALAVLSHLAGVLVQRWLFFAEARHVVGLYYGR